MCLSTQSKPPPYAPHTDSLTLRQDRSIFKIKALIKVQVTFMAKDVKSAECNWKGESHFSHYVTDKIKRNYYTLKN